MLDSNVVVGAALVNSEEHLLVVNRGFKGIEVIHFLFAALEPPYGSVAGIFRVRILCRVCDAFIKGHGNG